jgi:hypothetical protein
LYRRLKAGFDLRDLGGLALLKDGLKLFASGGAVGFVHDPPCFSGVIMAATYAKEKRNRIKALSFFHKSSWAHACVRAMD